MIITLQIFFTSHRLRRICAITALPLILGSGCYGLDITVDHTKNGHTVQSTPIPTDTTYRCSDNQQVTVHLSDSDISLDWGNGRTMLVPRVHTDSDMTSGNLYLGKDVSIEHDTDRIVIHYAGKPAMNCMLTE